MRKYINFLIVTLLLAFNAEARVYNSAEDIILEPAVGFTVQINSASVSASQPLKLGASKEFITGAIDLTSEISGILPLANGGTGSATQNFVDLTTNQTILGNKIVSGTLTTTLPFGAGQFATGDLPAAASNDGYIAYDTTLDSYVFSDGITWEALGGGSSTTVDATSSVTTEVVNGNVVVNAMTISPAAGDHTVSFNTQYSTAAGFVTAQAKTDLAALVVALEALPIAGGARGLAFGTEIVNAGVYDLVGAATGTTLTTLTLDGQSDPDALFVFRITTTFTMAASFTIDLINDANPNNVFFISGGATSIGTGSNIQGNFIAKTTGAGTTSTLLGRLVSTAGALTPTTLTINKPPLASTTQTLGTVEDFALFTSAGAVTNAGISVVNGDVGTEAGAITGFLATSTVNGSFYTPTSTLSNFSLGVYLDGVLVPGSNRTVTEPDSVSDVIHMYTPVTTTAGQTIDVRVQVSNGSFTVGNRTLSTKDGSGGAGGGASGSTAGSLATTGADVVISGAAAPTVGQALIATSSTVATWQTIAAGGAAGSLETSGADVVISASAAPTIGQILTATSGTVATWQSPAAVGGSGLFDDVTFTSGTTPSTPLAGNITTYSDNTSGLLSQVDSNGVVQSVRGFKQSDVLTNASFEESHAGSPALGWTCAFSGAGTANVETTTKVITEGSQSLRLDLSGETFSCSQTFDCSTVPVIPVGFTALVNSTSDVQVCGFDGVNDLNCVTPSSDDSFQLALAEVSGGGTCGVKIKSDVAITDSIFVDGITYTDSPYRFVDIQNTTDWTSYSLVIDAVTTAPTLGATGYNNARWRRVGDSMEIRYELKQTTAGTAGSGVYLFPLPSGHVIDTSKLTTANGPQVTVGHAWVANNANASADASRIGTVSAYDSSNLTIYSVSPTDTPSAIGSTTLALGGADILYSFTATVPIIGWSATSQHVATPLNSNLTDFTVYTPITQGFGTETAAEYHYKRVGDSVQISANFDTGTVQPSELQLGLPSVDGVQLTVSSKYTIPTLVGESARNLSTTSDIRITATGGDAFVNFVQDSTGYKTAQTGSTIYGSTESVTVWSVLIPVNEWSSEATIIGAFPFDRVQTKTLSANHTTVATISDLSFSNLVIDKLYQICAVASVRFGTNNGGADLIFTHNSVEELKVLVSDDSTVDYTATAGGCATFKAAATTLSASSSTASGGSFLNGNATHRTKATLTELNTTKETTQF
jgi:hypothetical protein